MTELKNPELWIVWAAICPKRVGHSLNRKYGDLNLYTDLNGTENRIGFGIEGNRIIKTGNQKMRVPVFTLFVYTPALKKYKIDQNDLCMAYLNLLEDPNKLLISFRRISEYNVYGSIMSQIIKQSLEN